MLSQSVISTTKQASEHQWSAYYDAIKGKPPERTLLMALEFFDKESPSPITRLAVDLGCGSGRDTIELLGRGWRVSAIDSEQAAISQLLSHSHFPLDLLSTEIARFEEVSLPSPTDLINASFSLPFCSPRYFPDFWTRITASLHSGGRVCGQLFGDRDSWSTQDSMTFHTRKDVDILLRDFEIEFFEEEEFIGDTALDGQKNWHIFHMVAKKA
jgi:tellurite methyltransferase